jgi:hypothetical protein
MYASAIANASAVTDVPISTDINPTFKLDHASCSHTAHGCTLPPVTGALAGNE